MPVGNLKNSNCAITNGNDVSSDSGNSGSSNSETSHPITNPENPGHSNQPLQVNNETAFQSGQLPVIADVRSPDVLHAKSGPCDCLSHPIPVSKTLSNVNINYFIMNLYSMNLKFHEP